MQRALAIQQMHGWTGGVTRQFTKVTISGYATLHTFTGGLRGTSVVS